MGLIALAFLLLSAFSAHTTLCVADDIGIATQQRLSVIVGSTTGATSISAWLLHFDFMSKSAT
jgi:hypothetical protein